jgi:hypothetical protein
MIIAFSGKIGSGKTSACKYLELRGFKLINFKDALICELKERFPDLLEYLSKELYKLSIDNLFRIKPPVVRKLLQNYGTNVRRNDDVNYWVNKWLEKIIIHENICVDDCRFINEAMSVKSKGGIIIRLEREQLVEDLHLSETEIDQLLPDYTIDSNGTLLEMYNNLEKLLVELGI